MNQNENRFDKFIAVIRELLVVISIAIAVIGVLILLRNIVNAVFLYNYDHDLISYILNYLLIHILYLLHLHNKLLF